MKIGTLGFMLIGLLALVFLISGCLQGKENLVYFNAPFQLKINQISLIPSENITIKFVDLTEDSRCPSDVVCVWEGQAKIIVNIIKNNQNLGDYNLTSRAGHEELAIKNFDGYSIKLLKIEPYPKSTQKIEKIDYVATLIVSTAKTEKQILCEKTGGEWIIPMCECPAGVTECKINCETPHCKCSNEKFWNETNGCIVFFDKCNVGKGIVPESELSQYLCKEMPGCEWKPVVVGIIETNYACCPINLDEMEHGEKLKYARCLAKMYVD